MFRLVSNTQVLKSRVSTQLSHARPLRGLNSVSMDRSPSQELAAMKQQQSQQVQQAIKKARSFRNNVSFNESMQSPWQHQVMAFEDCVSQTLSISQARNQHPHANFWDSLSQSMSLYRQLLETPELSADRVSKLIHLLHNGLRANRNQLTRLNKKPDYDSESFHKEMTNYLCESLREVSQDILSGKVGVNEYGAMHLITAFKELLLYEEAVMIWKHGLETNNRSVFMSPRVVGVVLPLLYEQGMGFQEIDSLYNESASKVAFFHPNLSVGMIRACLAAGETKRALELFTQLCNESKEAKFGYLIETHLSFIGESKDLNIARIFFEKALNNEMPYKIDLQVSYVKSFMRNVWGQTRDFAAVYDIWYKASVHYGKTVNHGISSSLNDTFFQIFFEKYPTAESAEALQQVIATYNTIKPIDEPFFNIILTHSSQVWRSLPVIQSVGQAYDTYGIPKTIVAHRILLKSLGYVSVANEEIVHKWEELVSSVNQGGFIANADWAALRDATVAASIANEYDPAMAAFASSGADEPQDRVKLYAQILRLYSPYCRDSRQFARLSSGIARKHPVLNKYLNNLESLDTQGLTVVPLQLRRWK